MTQTLAVMMAKDEADVIRGTITHLLDEVDQVYVADNASTDGTRDILADLERDQPSLVHVFDDPDPAYFQSRKMSALADLAAQDSGDPEPWIVPVDADEIWYWEGDRIRNELQHVTTRVVAATLFNHFPTGLDPQAASPFDSIIYRQADPGTLAKVAFQWESGAVIHQGNHGVTLPSARGRTFAGSRLRIRHFPYRTVEQMIRKACNGAAAYAATDLPETEGAHWREYGALYENGGREALEEVFNKWFHFDTPVLSGLVRDPAPFLRWQRDTPAPRPTSEAAVQPPVELGRVAYDAYGQERGWVVVGGGSMPAWDEQSDELRKAWEAAAQAVAAEVAR